MGKITAVDRLIFTLIFSIILHLVIILGVSFTVTSPPTNTPLASLDITLVKQQTKIAPEQADYLAQVSNEGGGITDDKSPEPSPENSLPVTQQAASPSKKAPPPILEAPIPAPLIVVKPLPVVPKISEQKPEPVKPKPVKPAVSAEQAKLITQQKAKRKVEQVNIADITEPATVTAALSASDLIFQARNEIENLQKQLDNAAQSLSKRPKKRRVSASTKEYAAAAYMKSWEIKVERIGNMNYPQAAKRQGINGHLMLSVDINPDGSVPPDGIVVSRSSGHKVLDDAAVKIVRLGAPYSAIPDNVLLDNDMLTIIRTWKFETNQGLSAR